MKSAKELNSVQWPNGDINENFSFSAIHPDGVFKFTFKYFNDRWNAWVQLPDGETRAIGVAPNVISCTGFLDYGFAFSTDLTEIDKESLRDTVLLIITWE